VVPVPCPAKGATTRHCVRRIRGSAQSSLFLVSVRVAILPQAPRDYHGDWSLPRPRSTLRAPSENGWFGRDRSETLSFATLSVSVPPNRQPGRVNPGFANPDPLQDFTIAARQDMDSDSSFVARVRRALRDKPPNEREITLFVHGYNNSFLDGVYRMAQLYHDLELPGVPVHYSWPSAANPLGYTYDRDSVLFARDGLEATLRDMQRAGARRIILVGHSLGTMLVMETLRQIEIRDPGWSDDALGGVVLISPDLDVELFEMQARRISTLPEPFAIFVNKRDRALALSARLNGRTNRLGNLTDPAALAEHLAKVGCSISHWAIHPC
jgi:esterase/lipase superfamily enzyme